MELFELLRHIRSNPLNPKASMAVDARRIADEYPQLKTQGQVGALGHAYGTKVAGKFPMDMYERFIDNYDSPYDRRNNAVASRFFNDLEKTNPSPNFLKQYFLNGNTTKEIVSLDDNIRKAKRSILGMQDTKNPHPVPYNWDVKYNNSESPPPMTGFLKEEDPVRWYDNVHSILFPQANAGIIDYQPNNQQQNQQQNQQPIAPQIPDTPVSPNPHIDPPLVPDEIIIPVPDTKTDEMVRVWGPGVPGSKNIPKHMADWILTNYPHSETSNRYQQSGWDTSKGTGPDSGWVPLYNYPILSYTNDMAQAYADANPD